MENNENIDEKSEIIKIIGVGGAGGNAVNNMYNLGIVGVNYVICNTDIQALEASPIKTKIQLGKKLTAGLGAGNNPEKGRQSAEESVAEIDEILNNNTRMVFVAAGMGGGTGTGAAPVIAKQAKDKGILTIGIVTIPYRSEGKPRLRQAIRGVRQMSENVDSLLVINSQRLSEIYGDMSVRESLAKADLVLATAAKGIAELISKHMVINVDFADVQTAMTDSGCAVMGTGEARGENRAIEAVELALKSPLLNNNDINGASYILVNITSGIGEHETTQTEQLNIMDYLYEHAGGDDNENSNIIWGLGTDQSIDDDTIRVTVVATGFSTDCFEISQSKNVDVSVPLGSTEVIGKKYGDEKEITVKFEDPQKKEDDKILMNLYDNPLNGMRINQPKKYTTRDLRDATSLPLENLTEEVLSNIENVPAYERRQNTQKQTL